VTQLGQKWRSRFLLLLQLFQLLLLLVLLLAYYYYIILTGTIILVLVARYPDVCWVATVGVAQAVWQPTIRDGVFVSITSNVVQPNPPSSAAWLTTVDLSPSTTSQHLNREVCTLHCDIVLFVYISSSLPKTSTHSRLWVSHTALIVLEKDSITTSYIKLYVLTACVTVCACHAKLKG